MASAPKLARTAEWATHPDVVKAFILRTLTVAQSRPAKGRRLALTARRIALHPCDQVQVLGILAQCQRVLGDLDGARARLEDAFELGGDCPECLADLYRRRSYAHASAKEHEPAFLSADRAVREYESLGTRGHDLYGNGLASSYLARGAVLFHAGSIADAADDMGRCLALIDKATSDTLTFLALHNYALVLLKLGTPSDLLKAEEYLKQARQHFKGSSRASQQRAKLAWVTAMVREELRRNPPPDYKPPSSSRQAKLREVLTRARTELVELGYVDDAVALTADLARIAFPETDRIPAILSALRGDLARFGRRIPENLLTPVRCLEAAVDRVSTWAGDGGALGLVASYEEVKAAIEKLREACGEKTMACLLTWKPVF